MRRLPIHAILAAFFAAGMITGVACDRAQAPGTPTTTTAKSVLEWDLSEDQDIARVNWPIQITDNIWFIDGPIMIHLTVPSGQNETYTADKVRIRRNGRKISNVYMLFPEESLDATYQRAMRLADDWDLQHRTRLNEWYGWHGRPPAGSGRTRDEHVRDRTMAIRVSVRPSNDVSAPWYATFSYGFPQNGESNPAPATKPETAVDRP